MREGRLQGGPRSAQAGCCRAEEIRGCVGGGRSPGWLCRTCDCVLEGCGSWPWLTGGLPGIYFLLHQFAILHFHLCECLFALGEILANSWLKMKVLRRFQNGSDFFGFFLTTCFRKEESTEKDILALFLSAMVLCGNYLLLWISQHLNPLENPLPYKIQLISHFVKGN